MLFRSMAIAHAASLVKQDLPSLQNLGGILGASVSGIFLWIIGFLNLSLFLQMLKVWQRVRRTPHRHVRMDDLLQQRGLINRLLGGGLRKLMNHSWQMYPLGLLFGLGFDTASEVGMLAMSVGASTANLPTPAVLSLPILFAAAMCLMDTTDGVLMSKAYSWALLNPLRKIAYNLTTTGLTVAVALMIGTVELMQVFTQMTRLHGPTLDFVAGLDMSGLGYLIVGILLCAWISSVMIWKLGKGWSAVEASAEVSGDDGCCHRADEPR